MPAAAPVLLPPPTTTPGPTAQWLAKLLAVGGLFMVAGATVLSVSGHLSAELAHQLFGIGAGLVAGSAGIYGVFTTFLKYAAQAKQYEPEAEAVAALIPGVVGTDIRIVLGLLEKALNVIAVSSPVDPSAVAKLAGAQAAASATPSAGPGSPSAA